jgi:hypothetical protein
VAAVLAPVLLAEFVVAGDVVVGVVVWQNSPRPVLPPQSAPPTRSDPPEIGFVLLSHEDDDPVCVAERTDCF